ncbi:unnamed protein product, partial [Mesorhabditis spiculigera]
MADNDGQRRCSLGQLLRLCCCLLCCWPCILCGLKLLWNDATEELAQEEKEAPEEQDEKEPEQKLKNDPSLV